MKYQRTTAALVLAGLAATTLAGCSASGDGSTTISFWTHTHPPMIEVYEKLVADYEARLDKEIAVIHRVGFAGYFLIVWDFIKYAKEHGIPVGPGRGSAAGSLVAFCMQITDIDPASQTPLWLTSGQFHVWNLQAKTPAPWDGSLDVRISS